MAGEAFPDVLKHHNTNFCIRDSESEVLAIQKLYKWQIEDLNLLGTVFSVL